MRASLMGRAAAGVLALALQISLGFIEPALAERPSVIPGALPGAVPGHRYTAAQLDAEKAAVLALDNARLVAWRKGDVGKLDPILAVDATFIDGLASGADQSLSRAQFLARVKSNHLSKTVAVSDRAVRTFGIEDDVAVVNGILKDSKNAADTGSIYTAIYLRKYDNSWELARYQVSPMQNIPQGPAESSPAQPWSADSLSASELRVMEILRRHFGAMARRDNDEMEKTIGDEFWYIRAATALGVQRGKAEYMALKKVSTGAPELVSLDKPDIQFYGQYGEVAVVTGIRRDATGGAIYGPNFKPQWRSVSYYTAVVFRPDTTNNDWFLEHYHASHLRP